MMKFKLKEATVKVRDDQQVRVRELTHAERLQWVKTATEDRFRGPALLISLSAVDPKISEEEAGTFPTDVVTQLSAEIMKLSNMEVKTDAKTDAAQPVKT